MPIDCVRSITFMIPGTAESPGVQVTATEIDLGAINEGGAISFEVEVIGTSDLTADLRGLFFNLNDDLKLDGLEGSGSDVTSFDTDNVINLGRGVNMLATASPFDFGVEFGEPGITKDDIQSTTFLLTNSANNLTLDDLTHVNFGARLTSVGDPEGNRNNSSKLVATAPAAPDANDDTSSIFEDGQDGLDDPSTVPEGTVFQVLDNDTDADGDTLTITNVLDVLHGTVEIVDGDDADLLPGDAILYTPDEDYSGEDGFKYVISDNNGGTDFAFVEVDIEAVADIPDLDVQVSAGDQTNEIKLTVTAAETDADHSEYIDRILTAPLPDGATISPVSVNPAGEPGQIIQEYVLSLTPDRDYDFDLAFTAVSKEMSNGDEESATVSIPIALDHNTIAEDRTFLAQDQSMWTTGAEFVFDDERFIGINVPETYDSWGGIAPGDLTYALKTGFDSDLHFEGGDIDAQVPWHFDVETIFNKTTDILQIDTDEMILAGGGFQTDGPALDYVLDFILNYKFILDLNHDVPLIPSGGIIDVNWQNNFTQNIINYDSDTSAPIDIGFWNDAITVELAWPNLEVAGTETAPSSGVYTGNGASNNALNVNLDVDQAIANIFFGGANPFDFDVDISILGVGGGVGVEILDADVAAGLNFLQDFQLQAGDVEAILTFEDGSSIPLTLGSSIELTNASLIDAGGNGDGIVDGTIGLNLKNSTLSNDTDLGFNVGWNFDLLQGDWWYNAIADSDSGTWGPIFDFGEDQIPVFDADIFADTIGVNFGAADSMIFLT